MNPLLLSALLSFAPDLLSKLFGGDPRQAYRRAVAQLLASRPGMTNTYYNQVLGSPAYSQGQSNIAAGANQAANTLGASLGARGIGTTGTGAVLSSLVPSLVGSQQAGLKSAAYSTASEQADRDIQAQLAALTGSQGPSQSTQLFGAGLSAFGPLLAMWLKSKYPGMSAQPATAGAGSYTGGNFNWP